MSSVEAGPLTCPRCALSHPGSERFCRECGMPLVYAGTREQEPITDAHERARKVNPQHARGELVRVTGGRNLSEAELIQGILLDQGIPSVLRRTRGFDVPDFLAAGPRDVLVPESGAQVALEVLNQTGLAPSEVATARPNPVKLVAAIALGGAAAALLAYLLQG